MTLRPVDAPARRRRARNAPRTLTPDQARRYLDELARQRELPLFPDEPFHPRHYAPGPDEPPRHRVVSRCSQGRRLGGFR